MGAPKDRDRRRRRMATTLAAACLLSFGAAGEAQAIGFPIAGRFLSLRVRPAGVEIRFVSRDPSFPFPVLGSLGGDPANTGLDIEIFTAGEGAVTLQAPPGVGNPGWKLGGSSGTYRYRTGGPVGPGEIRKVLIRDGRLFRARGQTGLSLQTPVGAAAVRVRMGSVLACALFAGPSVRRDVVGSFVARYAPASALSDCEEATILIALGFECPGSRFACGGSCPGSGICAPDVLGGPCRCNFDTQACGGTAPVCNGACPAGEQCWPIDGLIPGAVDQCRCGPVGIAPCGTSGLSCAEGFCPEGLVCMLQPGIGVYDSYCACTSPNPACGPGYGACPPDLECLPVSRLEFACVPQFCGGTYPACSGSCGTDRACVPLSVAGQGYCVCASTAGSCDVPTCEGGLFCPTGEVCSFTSDSCACEPL